MGAEALNPQAVAENIQQIYIETVPENGLGVAIMDRMKKAAYKYSV